MAQPILFLKDWSRFPTAIIDDTTTNRSWVRMATVLRKIGIVNNAFFLALVNPRLKGIDPFSPDLTETEMAMIAIECKINPWYYLREIARAPGQSGSASVPLELNRGNLALWWCFFNHVFVFLVQIRQTGKSLSTDELMVYLLSIVCTDTQINLMTKDDTLRKANIERVKEIFSELPKYLQQRSKNDTSNTEEITVKRLGNTYKTHVPAKSAKDALNKGRGLTSPIVQIDEAPFQSNIEIALPSILAATGAAVDRAKEVGAPYGTIITTTAGKKDDRDGRYIYKMISEAAVWTERLFDSVDEVELELTIRSASRTRIQQITRNGDEVVRGEYMVNITLNHRQLGKTDKWLDEKLQASKATGEAANRDYFNLWTSGNASHPLEVNLLDRIANSVTDPAYVEITKQRYMLRWFVGQHDIEWMMANDDFILGADTSEASGGDDIGLYLISATTLETVMVANIGISNIITFSAWLCDFLKQYQRVTAIVERRSTGSTVLDYLLLMLPEANINPFKRLWNKIVHEAADTPDTKRKFQEVQIPVGRMSSDFLNQYKKYFGFATSGSGITARGELYGTVLRNAAEQTADVIRDKPLIDQIMGLEVRNYRVDHAPGEHDDLVIGFLLTHWLLRNGKNLAYYGIDPTTIPANAGKEIELSDEDLYERHLQAQARSRLAIIVSQMETEYDEFILERLAFGAKQIEQTLVRNTEEIQSVDMLLEQLKERRRKKYQNAFDSNGVLTIANSWDMSNRFYSL